MGLPKKKNNIEVYTENTLTKRRQELLDMITKSDPYLPDSILHDDLDRGMLDYVEKNFIVVSDGQKIPTIPRILTMQRWSELSNTWEYVDDDGNIQLPFISVVRKPDVQPGTNPSVQRTIPDRARFHYSTIKTVNDGVMGADVYKIPQPIAVDISYEVTIICNKFRDLNKFNKSVMQNFSSRQDYTMIKGHYIPIILDRNDDSSPIDTLEGRRYYIQTYHFTMLGFLIDSEEFEVKPAINRTILLTEFIDTPKVVKKVIRKTIDITNVTFISDGIQTVYSVNEPINILFHVSVNGLKQRHNIDFLFIPGSSRITFINPPLVNATITITYYKGNTYLNVIDVGEVSITQETFVYSGTTLDFNTLNAIVDIVSVDINGLLEIEDVGYELVDISTFRILTPPVVGSNISITYLY